MFLTCKYNKQKIIELQYSKSRDLFETETRPETFKTKTRKNGSRDSITGLDIDVHSMYYREYWFPYCVLGSDEVSGFVLGLETFHFSSLSLEGLRSCLGLDHKHIRLRL